MPQFYKFINMKAHTASWYKSPFLSVTCTQNSVSRVWGHTSVILVLSRPRQEDPRFHSRLGDPA